MIRTDHTTRAAARRYSLDPDAPDRWHDGVISGLLLPRYLGRLLMEPMREAGLEPRAVRERACEECIEGSIDTGGFTPWGDPIEVGCDPCNGTSTLPYDCMDLVDLQAYCGDPSARDLVPKTKAFDDVRSFPSWPVVDDLPSVEKQTPFCESGLGVWLTGLERLASKLPRTPETKGECSDCVNTSARRAGLQGGWDCFSCNGTGKTTHHGYPAERYLLVAAAHRVAREVLESTRKAERCLTCRGTGRSWAATKKGMARCGRCSGRGRRMSDPDAYVVRALDACAAWLACPCPKHEAAWEKRSDSWTSIPRWVPSSHHWHGVGPTLTESVLAAAEFLDPTRVRTVAAEAVLERL